MMNFDDTKIAFSDKRNSDLRKATFLFKLVGNPTLLRLGKWLLNSLLKINFPINWIIKPTVFKQFCGGESIEESAGTVELLEKKGVKTYLAYSVEAKEEDEDFDAILNETIDTIKFASNHAAVPFTVFKPTAFIPVAVLEKINGNMELNVAEQEQKERYENRVDTLCHTAYDSDVVIFFDAEETFYQNAMDELAFRMMGKYNKDKAIVYNTCQMYRWDRLQFLKDAYQRAVEKKYYLGVKLVRGAYMEIERARAKQRGLPSPIQKNKESTDRDYNLALEFCLDHLDRISFVCATHNEKSVLHMTAMMEERKMARDDSRVFFGQLYGMSDHMTFNIAHAGYNVVKYVPYGPVKEVLPYLIRRAEENSSVAGQTGRELGLILKERERRKR